MTIGWCATTATATISPMAKLRLEGASLHGDVLHVAEEIEAPPAALAADARPSRSSERRVEVTDEEAIDPHGAGDDSGRHSLGAREIARVDHGREAVLGAVGQMDRLVFGIERLPGENGSEDF